LDPATKAIHIDCILFSRAANMVGICQQKQLKLTSSRAAKSFGICQQKQFKLLYFVQPRSEKFGICQQKQSFVQPRNESFGICLQTQLKLTVF
jgi:hypothetical protein